MTTLLTPDLDYQFLDRELDKAKSGVFIGNSAAFLGSILCNLNFSWNRSIPTAATDGINLWWNPDWFLKIPPIARRTVLVHELWHPARLHFARMGNRDPKVWNYACVPTNTMVAMADGTEKPVQHIVSGDCIRNVTNGTSVVALRINSIKKKILNIRLENGMLLRCSGEHRVLTEHGFQTAAQLTTGVSCFVDTRYGRNTQERVVRDTNSGDRGSPQLEVPTGGSKSVHLGIDQNSQAIPGYSPNASTLRSRMGLSCRAHRRGRDHHHHQQNDERQAIPTAQNASHQYLPEDAGLADSSGLQLDTQGEQPGMLVFHHAHSADPIEGRSRKALTLAGHEAALSNARAALVRAEDAASLQVHINARNALHSRANPYLEYSRIIEIWESDAEGTYDLITSDHHFIANGVVVHNCDIRINNDLKADGFSFEGLESAWLDPSFPPGTPEEDIYDALIARYQPPPKMDPWGLQPGADPDIPSNGGDMVDPGTLTKDHVAQVVGNIIRAVHQAKLGGGAGSVPGDVEQIINRFLTPIIPWEQHLHQFMRDLHEEAFTWTRPNRRFTSAYLPSRYMDEGRLEKLHFYEDVSGSITDEDAIRFNSEVKYVKDFYNPRELCLIQFDTQITQEITFREEDRFDQVKIIGRGGTWLGPVREHIIKHRPTAVIIFSDLECDLMEPLPFDVPIIWVAIRNHKATVPFGKLIHIR